MPKNLPKNTWSVMPPSPEKIQELIRMNPRASSSRGLESWQQIESALKTKSLDNPWSLCAAAATAAVETCHTFLPINEIGNEAYFTKLYWDEVENRKALGNTFRAAAALFHGRGVIQLTGQNNYMRCGRDIGIDLYTHPEKALDPEISAKIFLWYWSTHHLADVAKLAADMPPKSAGRLQIWQSIRRTVNGPKMNGWQSYYNALEVLGAA